ncbi:MAG: glycosyltransferase [Candidatus Kapabacteria bacterium]|jgi:glycosyltransferase involved in cell wall biosynthesis|nr:glycosyltransferase [Candidatus Kapabacteria bacterium]
MTDVLLLALSDVSTDARTLNCARTLADAGLQVQVCAAGSGAEEPFHLLRWIDPGGRAARRWWNFHRFAVRVAPPCRVVAAMDFFALTAARAIAGKRRPPAMLYDAREFMFSLGPLQGQGLRQRIIEHIERICIRRADAVTVSGPLDAAIIAQRYGLPFQPVVVLNTPPNASIAPTGLLRAACGVSTNTVLALYQGVVHHGRGLAPMMRAMTIETDVHLAVIGDGPALAELKDMGVHMGLGGRIHWLGSKPYDELPLWTAGATIGLTLIEPVSESYRYALPNKFFEFMRVGVPQLVTDLPALRAIMEDYPVGVMVSEELSERQIAEAIRRLRHPETYQAFVGMTKRFPELAYDAQAHRVIDLYTALAEAG